MTTKSNKVGTAKAVKNEETQANVTAEVSAEVSAEAIAKAKAILEAEAKEKREQEIAHFKEQEEATIAKQIELTKGLRTICGKIEGLTAVDSLNKIPSCHIEQIVNMMTSTVMIDGVGTFHTRRNNHAVNAVLKNSMEFLARIQARVKKEETIGKDSKIKLDLSDDDEETDSYKVLLAYHKAIKAIVSANKAGR